MPVYGWDGSDYDYGRGPVDVPNMLADLAPKVGGIRQCFVTFKATEGTKFQHRYLQRTLNLARDDGVELLGAYIVPRTPGNGGNGTIAQQCDYYLSYLDAQIPWWRSWPGFFIQVDTEHWGSYDLVNPAIGTEVCTRLRAATDRFVAHYAPRWAYGNSIPGSDPLWASAYGDNVTAGWRTVWQKVEEYRAANGYGPWPDAYSGRVPLFWQFGSRATIGSQPTCDVNAVDGSYASLRSLIISGGAAVGSADQAFDTDYPGTGTWINPKSWMVQAVELPLRGLGTSPGRTIGRDVREIWYNVWNGTNGEGGQHYLGRQLDKVDALLTAVAKVAEAVGVAQADLDDLQARPAATLSPEQLKEITDALIAAPDNPLGEADSPAIETALENVLGRVGLAVRAA